MRAQVWGERDELITLSQAAELTGRTLNSLSQMVIRGALVGYPDPEANNPQHATRVRRSEVLRLRRRAVSGEHPAV